MRGEHPWYYGRIVSLTVLCAAPDSSLNSDSIQFKEPLLATLQNDLNLNCQKSGSRKLPVSEIQVVLAPQLGVDNEPIYFVVDC